MLNRMYTIYWLVPQIAVVLSCIVFVVGEVKFFCYIMYAFMHTVPSVVERNYVHTFSWTLSKIKTNS